ncbi:MAG: hypothetical protein RSE62_03440 [Citrobacter sp.]
MTTLEEQALARRCAGGFENDQFAAVQARARLPVPTPEERAKRALHLRMQQALTTSYLQARALVELLTMLSNTDSGFPVPEQVKMQTALVDAQKALSALSSIVDDKGNQQCATL